ncbi:MAG TPA: hypothetical protein VGO45_05585, partial [Bacteroidia bacterium]|nr:hypothetical protein [Bacteroidia bacterium]
MTKNTAFPCWRTTASDSSIEVWWSGFNGVPAYSGNQFIELNAYQVASMYQNFNVPAGSTISIGFAHRGRAGIDSMSVSVGPVGGPYINLGTFGDGNSAWSYRTLAYTIPTGLGTNYSLRFNSVYSTGNNQSIGNFLDDISVNLPGVNTVSLTSSAGPCGNPATGSATATVSGGTPPYSYSWSPSGGTSATANNLGGGTYVVHVTDASGCITKDSVKVISPPVITLNLTASNTTCSQPLGSATAAVTGGTGSYTYSWSPSGGNTSSATGLAAGTYTMSITDANGCTKKDSVKINPPSSISVSLTSVNGNCSQSGGSATAHASGGTGGYTYSWSPAGGNASTATGLTSGTYTVHITDAGGCSVLDTVKIVQLPPITVSVASTNGTCMQPGGTATASATGGSGSYTYNWVPSGGNSATASGLSAGTYTIKITDSNGCVSKDSVSITQAPVLSLLLSSSNITCIQPQGTATASVTGGTGSYTYSWSPAGGNAATASGLPAGTYTITITDAGGCSRKDSVKFTQPPLISVFMTSNNGTCLQPGGSATVHVTGGTGNYTYSWSPGGGTSPTVSGLPAGNYTVNITDAGGCTAID